VAGEFADDSTQPGDALADAARFGLSQEEIDGLREALGRQQTRKLWAMHLDAFAALMAGATQWRTRLVPDERGPVERVVGLDYGGLKVALDALGIRLSPASWTQLAVHERAAAGALNGEPSPAEAS
jgi:hypothetical protein